MQGEKPAVLLLCHRIPYPPDKGDKIRSYRWLIALAERFRVHLGAFVDDPADWAHERHLRGLCESLLLLGLPRRPATLRSLSGLIRGEPLSLPYYRDARMRRWVDGLLGSGEIRQVLAYSGAMAQYLMGPSARGVRRVIDFVDVDSDKWAQYAERKSWPLSWVYAREARRLGAFELEAARALEASLFVSREEAELLRSRCPEIGLRIGHIANGVDTDYFDPSRPFDSPFAPGRPAVVFTGAMDYWANEDAAIWLARELWPRIQAARPEALLAIVGSRPGPQVRSLAGPDVLVTGRVPDVRPYLRHAQAVVAPMRVARGIQNKVLEGMAMARPVVVTAKGLEGIDAQPGLEVLVADSAPDFAQATIAALDLAYPEMGERARRRVLVGYSWADASRRLIDSLCGEPAAAEPHSAPYALGSPTGGQGLSETID